MSTLGNDLKMGYYPLPPTTLEYLRNYFVPDDPDGEINILDPFAGRGDALSALGETLNAKTYGAELSADRAEAAAEINNVIVRGDWYTIVCSHDVFGLALVNPKYDFTHRDDLTEPVRREEYKGLQSVMEYLTPKAALIFVVPRHILGSAHVSRYVSNRFSHLTVFRMPEDEGDQFGQVVILGTKKSRQAIDNDTNDKLRQIGRNELEPEELTRFPVEGSHFPLSVPSTPRGTNIRFYKRSLSASEVRSLASASNIYNAPAWKAIATPSNALLKFRPVVTLRRGHVAQLLAGNVMGSQRLGTNLVVKGMAVKNLKPAPSLDPKKKLEDETFAIEVTVLRSEMDRTGKQVLQARVIKKPDELENFLIEHGDLIATTIRDLYPPLYNEPDPAQWNKLGALIPFKKLPGRKKAGLFSAQKHVVLASCASLDEHNVAQVIAEMGYGKTTVALAIAFVRDNFPMIVVCPSHLVEKWAKEVKDVLPKGKPVIVDSLALLEKTIRQHRDGEQLVVIMSKEKARTGSGWAAAYNIKQVALLDSLGAPQHDENGKLKMQTALTCPTCGEFLLTEKGGAMIEEKELRDSNKQMFCAVCNSPLFSYIGSRNSGSGSPASLRGFWSRQDRKPGEMRTGKHSREDDMAGQGRNSWPLARFILKKHQGFFKMVVGDEVHLFKGKDSDQARAFHHLCVACPEAVTLTGTYMGGRATDIFWLLYRLLPGVRDDFAFNGERQWVDTYGRNRYIESTQSKKGGNGKQTGTKRKSVTVKEIPGVNPAVAARLLSTVIFAQIADLGYDMPPYKEEIVYIPLEGKNEDIYPNAAEKVPSVSPLTGERTSYMRVLINGSSQQAIYTKIENWFLEKIKDFSSGRASWISTWLQTTLGYPNAAHRDELIMHKDAGTENVYTNVARITGLDIQEEEKEIGHLFPKEQWLINYCIKEKSLHRKVIVFVRQTGKRDIQPRVQAILQEAGLKATILPPSIQARYREKWIADHVDDFDIMICNPKRVETGLDLVEFATGIFYEIDYSLYTLWQAMRRIWRPGQRRAVKIVFAIYQETMEHRAMMLMQQKLRAALLLYGESAYSAIAEEGAGEDFMASLAHSILEKAEVDAGGIQALLYDGADKQEWSEETLTRKLGDDEMASAASFKAGGRLDSLNGNGVHGTRDDDESNQIIAVEPGKVSKAYPYYQAIPVMEDDAYDLIPEWLHKYLPPEGRMSGAYDAPIWARLFMLGTDWTWYINGYDKANGILSGYLHGSSIEPEWGTVFLKELKEQKIFQKTSTGGIQSVERDLWFEPMPFYQAMLRDGLYDKVYAVKRQMPPDLVRELFDSEGNLKIEQERNQRLKQDAEENKARRDAQMKKVLFASPQSDQSEESGESGESDKPDTWDQMMVRSRQFEARQKAETLDSLF